MENLEEKRMSDKFILIVKGVLLSMFLTLFMIFILSIVLSFSNIKENAIIPIVVFISAFSILFGGFLVSKKMAKNGIMYGSLVGLIYMLIIYTISSIINFNFLLNMNSIIMIASGLFGGAIGGIIGVNLK